MAEIVIGVVQGDEAYVISRLADGQLFYSGGRAVIEGKAAETLRGVVKRLRGPFVVESGRVGLADCRLVHERSSRADAFSRAMPPLRLSRPTLSFTYASTYDPDEMDSLRPPAQRPA